MSRRSAPKAGNGSRRRSALLHGTGWLPEVLRTKEVETLSTVVQRDGSGRDAPNRELRLPAGPAVIDHHFLRHAFGKRLAKILGNERQSEVDASGDPAELQTYPSRTWMASGSTRICGNKAASVSAQRQCVVTRRPSNNPAAASRNVPEQTLQSRRAVRLCRRKTARIFGQAIACREPRPPTAINVSSAPAADADTSSCRNHGK